MADPNHLIFPEHRLALLLPCKVGNTSIKHAFAEALGYPTRNLHGNVNWKHSSKADVAALGPEYLVFAFVRNPYARFLSAWRDQVVDRQRFGRLGLSHEPTLDEVADMLPIDDQHWRSLVDEICVGKKIPADVVVKTDDMTRAWHAVVGRLWRDRGIRLPRIPQLNASSGAGRMTPHARACVARHYASDFAVFGYQP